MSFKYILFDLDGTLTDPKEGITKSVQYALRALGIDEPDLDQLLPFIGPPLMDSFRDFYGFDREKCLLGVKKYREYFRRQGIFENQVFSGTEVLLRSLKENGKIVCLATSKPEPFARQILDHFHLSGYFDEAVGCVLDESQNMTKADVIREAFRRLKLTEDELIKTVMVGDRKHDILAAKECGIPSVGVTFGYAPDGELEAAGANTIVHDFDELKACLLADELHEKNWL